MATEERNSWARAAHQLGLATWFGGSLMGAVGLNAAAKQASEPAERLAAGWARWTPVNAVGIVAFVGGGLAVMGGNKGRLAAQEGVARASMAKNILSLVALVATGYAQVLGQRLIGTRRCLWPPGPRRCPTRRRM